MKGENGDFLLQTARRLAGDSRTVLQEKMRYVDMHCDALTVEGAASVRGDTLRTGGCHMQFFAAFLREREGRFERTLAL